MARRWIGKVSFRDREKWLAPAVVVVEGSTILTAAAAAARAGKKKMLAFMGKRRIYEMTVNIKPEASMDDRESR